MTSDSDKDTRLKARSTAFRAVYRIIRPLAKLMLHQGLPATESIEALKVAFVASAEEDFPIDGKKPSNVRISILTGFDRNTTASIRDGRGARSEHYYNRAERCARGWHDEKEWQNEGKPIDLPFSADGHEPSFESLVKDFSGGIGPYPLRDEMLRAGMISQLADGKLRLLKPNYDQKLGIGPEGIPVIQVVGEQIETMINIMAYNVVQAEEEKRRHQQMLSYKNVSDEEAEQLNEIAKDVTTYAIARMTEWDDQRVSAGPRVEGTSANSGRRKTGISINFFDNNLDKNKTT